MTGKSVRLINGSPAFLGKPGFFVWQIAALKKTEAVANHVAKTRPMFAAS